MKYKQLIQLLEKEGWELYRHGKHDIYRHPKRSGQLTVPFHSKEVPTGTASRILKDAGIK